MAYKNRINTEKKDREDHPTKQLVGKSKKKNKRKKIRWNCEEELLLSTRAKRWVHWHLMLMNVFLVLIQYPVKWTFHLIPIPRAIELPRLLWHHCTLAPRAHCIEAQHKALNRYIFCCCCFLYSFICVFTNRRCILIISDIFLKKLGWREKWDHGIKLTHNWALA